MAFTQYGQIIGKTIVGIIHKTRGSSGPWLPHFYILVFSDGSWIDLEGGTKVAIGRLEEGGMAAARLYEDGGDLKFEGEFYLDEDGQVVFNTNPSPGMPTPGRNT